jgi:SpoIID/LytB domain protein
MVAVVVVTAGLLGGPLSGPARAVSTDQSYPVPGDGTYTVSGHGYGHGHGLSQYGGQGAARQGLSAAQILSFYYPGTGTAVLSNTPIRALITERTTHLLFASARTGLQVRDANGALTTLDPNVRFWRLAYTSTNGYLLQRLSGSSWLTDRTSATPLGFIGASSVREWQALGSTVDFTNIPSRDYRGELRLVWDGTTTTTVNVVPMESYLRGVVPRESPSSFPAAALQAQSVAARSYSANKRAYWATRRTFDVYDTTADQVYGGAAYYPTAASSATPLEAASTDSAIAATAGQVRTYGGQVILAQFSSSNGGFTSYGGEPYLVAQPDPYEKYSDNPYENWTTSLAVSTLRSWSGLRTLSWLYLHRETSSGGHVATVDLVGTDSAGNSATVTRTGNDFRAQFGWRSTYFGFASIRRPTTSDFNNDGRSDPTVFRPSTGTWYVRDLFSVHWGTSGDVPIPQARLR